MTVKRLTEKRTRRIQNYIKAKGLNDCTLICLLKRISGGEFSGQKSKLPNLVRLSLSWGLATNNGSQDGNQVTLTDFGREVVRKGKIE